jgi:CheY-like chemotaxis protein
MDEPDSHSAPSNPPGTIDVLLADDNLIVREGVRALIARHPDLRVVGVAADYDEVIQEALACTPHVLVTDIRMPPSFNREGIDAAKEVRHRHPGTGVVILSQYDDPGGLRVPTQGPHRRGQPAGRRHPRRRHRGNGPRPDHCGGTATAGYHPWGADTGGGGSFEHGGRGQADQGHRRGPPPAGVSRRCRSGGGVRKAGRGGVGGDPGRAPAPPPSPQGHSGSGRTGGDVVPLASWRPGGEASA